MGRMIDHKHRTIPRGKTAPMAKTSYAHVFCAACRIVILCPLGWNGELAKKPEGWVEIDHAFFCSADCYDKGEAKPVRERAQIAHVRMAPMSPDEQRGFNDALLGFDCVGHRPGYVKGHANGRAVYAMVAEAAKKLEEGRQ